MSRRYDYLLSVRYRCKHSETRIFTGRYKGETEDIRNSVAMGDCPECRKSKQEIDADIARASAEMGLPELKGSDNQVSWANRIRIKVARTVQRTRPDSMEALRKITNSKFWIDSRNLDPEKILIAVNSN